MRNLFLNACVCASLVVLVACDRPDLPTSPSRTEAERATTPSNQSDIIRVTAQKAGDNLVNLTISENLNMGLNPNDAVKDWNSGKVYVVRKCDGRESQTFTEYSNDTVNGVPNGKRTIYLPNVATCSGNLLNIRLRAEPVGGKLVEFAFPSPGIAIREPASLQFIRENGHTYINGTL